MIIELNNYFFNLDNILDFEITIEYLSLFKVWSVNFDYRAKVKSEKWDGRYHQSIEDFFTTRDEAIKRKDYWLKRLKTKVRKI